VRYVALWKPAWADARPEAERERTTMTEVQVIADGSEERDGASIARRKDDIERAKLRVEIASVIVAAITPIAVVAATSLYNDAQKQRDNEAAAAQKARDEQAAEARAQNDMRQAVLEGKRQFIQAAVLPLASAASSPEACKNILASWRKLYGDSDIKDIPVLAKCSDTVGTSGPAAEAAQLGVVAGYDTTPEAANKQLRAVQLALGEGAPVQVCEHKLQDGRMSYRTVAGPYSSPQQAEAAAITVRIRVRYAHDATVEDFATFCSKPK
jgi:hypothetical protein